MVFDTDAVSSTNFNGRHQALGHSISPASASPLGSVNEARAPSAPRPVAGENAGICSAAAD